MLRRRVGPSLDRDEIRENLASDLWDTALMTLRSTASTPSSQWIPGRKVKVLTTNALERLPDGSFRMQDPVDVPKASKKAEREPPRRESLKEQKARLQREIQELEEKLGKK